MGTLLTSTARKLTRPSSIHSVGKALLRLRRTRTASPMFPSTPRHQFVRHLPPKMIPRSPLLPGWDQLSSDSPPTMAVKHHNSSVWLADTYTWAGATYINGYAYLYDKKGELRNSVDDTPP